MINLIFLEPIFTHRSLHFFIFCFVSLCFLEMEQVNVVLEKLPHSFEDLAEKVTTVELWPYFMFVHYVLVALSIRARPGQFP